MKMVSPSASDCWDVSMRKRGGLMNVAEGEFVDWMMGGVDGEMKM